MVFGLTRPEIEPESTFSVADALSTRPLIDLSDGLQDCSQDRLVRDQDRDLKKLRHRCFFQFSEKTFWGSNLLISWFYDI